MTYSPIRGVKPMEIDGQEVMIPDTGWIYWESPAAVKLEEIGTFKTCKYKK